MNHYAARKIDDTRWKFSVRAQDKCRPTGFCASPHCKGHFSPADAREHYRKYLAETARFSHLRLKALGPRCEYPECCELSEFVVRIGPGGDWIYHVCEHHASSELLLKVIDPIEDFLSQA